MKVKRLPEDFCVEELSGVEPADVGRYALYRLRKTSVTTLDAVAEIQRRLKLSRQQLSWGGLKDRHAVTTQFLTIDGGPSRGFVQGQWKLEYLGRTSAPFGPADILGNRFQLRLRSLESEEIEFAQRELPLIARNGLANYFDDQRFGSRAETGVFVAEPWLRGDYESALKLAFAEPYFGDHAREKQQKTLLTRHWGDWAKCQELLARSHRRSIVTFLNDRPGDYRGAWQRVNADLRSLYLAAFQSHLWNQILSRVIVDVSAGATGRPVELATGEHAGIGELDDAQRTRLRALSIPLPSARLKAEEIADEWLRTQIESTLAQLGWTLPELKVKHTRDSFFSKGERAAIIQPAGLDWEVADDELHVGRQRLDLTFELPRGSYATMLVKRITR
ncbi:MAG: tRNA pseudouridine(13) synthase TruD [Planctomycetaceae bacterium]